MNKFTKCPACDATIDAGQPCPACNIDQSQQVTHQRETQLMLLDKLTRDHTAFGSFHELLAAPKAPRLPTPPADFAEWNTYRMPSGEIKSAKAFYHDLSLLAIAYDQAQETRGDSRRAFRS